MKNRTSWQIQSAVISALFLREMKTRFGTKKLGYFWAIIEPASIILIFWAMFGAHMRGANKGVEYPMLLLTGMIPFHYFTHINNSFENSFAANEKLFNYKQVKPLDTLFSRILIETLVTTFVFLFLLGIASLLHMNTKPHNILLLLTIFAELAAFSFGFGLCSAVITPFSETFPRIMGLIQRPLLFISGVFYSVDNLPENMRPIMLFNPLLHFIESFRGAFFSDFSANHASQKYMLLWIVSLNLIGLWLYNRLERRIIAS